jgi:anti-sigma B factor antagonist
MADRFERVEPLSATVARDGTTVTMALAGELDLASYPRAADALVSIEPGGRLIVDLRELTFIDSSGIRLLMQLDVRARDEGWELVIALSPGPVQRVLELCRMPERVMTVQDPATA